MRPKKVRKNPVPVTKIIRAPGQHRIKPNMFIPIDTYMLKSQGSVCIVHCELATQDGMNCGAKSHKAGTHYVGWNPRASPAVKHAAVWNHERAEEDPLSE